MIKIEIPPKWILRFAHHVFQPSELLAAAEETFVGRTCIISWSEFAVSYVFGVLCILVSNEIKKNARSNHKNHKGLILVFFIYKNIYNKKKHIYIHIYMFM